MSPDFGVGIGCADNRTINKQLYDVCISNFYLKTSLHFTFIENISIAKLL